MKKFTQWSIPLLVIVIAGVTVAVASARTMAPSGSAASIQACALLPDTTTSTRWTLFDAPYLTKAFKAAGVSAHGPQRPRRPAEEKSQAEQCLAQGAKVILIDSLDAGSGAAITNLAIGRGAKVIDYDRLIVGSKASYYVSFDNVKVGRLQGAGLVAAPQGDRQVQQQAGHRRAERRHHRQQREAVQAGLRLDPQPAVQVGQVQEGVGRRPVDGLEPRQGPHDLRPDARAQRQQDRRRARRERRHRRRRGGVAQGPRPEADPADRPGRDADRRPVHPRRLAERHRLQVGQPRGRRAPRLSRSTSSRASPSRPTPG